MAAASSLKITVGFSGDVVAQHIINAAANSASPASVEIKSLASGANTITVPTGGSTPTACVVVPPAGNAISITLKGVTGDTGIRLHDTNPSVVAVDSSVSSFTLTAGATITGVRLFWS